MILAVDIGNRQILIGGICEDEVIFTVDLSTDIRLTSAEYASRINSVLNLCDEAQQKVDGAVIASVVPVLTDIIKNSLKRLFGVNAMVVCPGIKTGLNILLDNPVQLGADLLAVSVGALFDHKEPLIAIDMGTATTYCVIDKKRRYIGGIICPGVETSLESLTLSASLLPQISFTPPERLIGRNTEEGMKSGIIYSNAAAIDAMTERIEKELGYGCTVVATGSIAEAIVPYCSRSIIFDKNILLKGLKIIYDKNN